MNLKKWTYKRKAVKEALWVIIYKNPTRKKQNLKSNFTRSKATNEASTSSPPPTVRLGQYAIAGKSTVARSVLNLLDCFRV